MEDAIIPFDLQRMFLGDFPALFFVEIILRTLLIYLYTLALLRWIGGRSVAQLSMMDFLLVIALGSAVGDSPFYPEVPLLAAMAVITVVVLINKGLDRLTLRSDRAKRVIDGRPILLARSGRLVMAGLQKSELSTTEAKSMLRVAGVVNLGQVAAAFIEPGGHLSVFRREEPQAGLAIVPPDDTWGDSQATPPAGTAKGVRCCADCGDTGAPADTRICPNCSARSWTTARQPHSADLGVLD